MKILSINSGSSSLKFSLFDIHDYKLAVASKYPVKECLEYDIKSLY